MSKAITYDELRTVLLELVMDSRKDDAGSDLPRIDRVLQLIQARDEQLLDRLEAESRTFEQVQSFGTMPSEKLVYLSTIKELKNRGKTS